MGSTTISSGEVMACAGAILGHSNRCSTAIYAHVQFDPAKLVADCISERIAAALAGVATIVTDAERERAASDEELLTQVAKVLANDNQDADRLRALLKLFVA